MLFILLIVFLFNSTQSMIGAFSLTKTSPYDLLYRKTKHSYTTFSARLIHRSSPELPFFNFNYTRNDHILNSLRTSMARSHYFSQSKATSISNYVAAPIFGYDFVMEYTMGTPPVRRYGVLDTGSSLTWFQCLPCARCYDQKGYPFFNPKTSRSYQQVYCSTYQCDMVSERSCWPSFLSRKCHYTIHYYGGSDSQGIVSMDTMSLSVDKETRATLGNLVFGCAHNSIVYDGIPGIVGVSNHSSSLHRQLGVSHFSYFLLASRKDISGEVRFGPGAKLSTSRGVSTPLLPSENGLYYINLTGMSVDGSDEYLSSDVFDGFYNRVIIDSGTTYTMLPSVIFYDLKQAVADQMYMYTEVKSPNWELCFKDYEGDGPEVAFQFTGLEYILCDANIWVWDHETQSKCFAFVRSYSMMFILGTYQQRNVEVGFDLQKNLLTFIFPDVCPTDVIDFLQ